MGILGQSGGHLAQNIEGNIGSVRWTPQVEELGPVPIKPHGVEGGFGPKKGQEPNPLTLTDNEYQLAH